MSRAGARGDAVTDGSRQLKPDAPHFMQPPSLVELFKSFLRLGATAFGGPAMVSYIRNLTVQDRHWMDTEMFRDGVALCQTIPGATAMQTAAFVGLQIRGVRDAAASFIGFGLPAFLLMFGLSFLYARFQSLPLVRTAFNGRYGVEGALSSRNLLSRALSDKTTEWILSRRI
jgi:chromate transporter